MEKEDLHEKGLETMIKMSGEEQVKKRAAIAKLYPDWHKYTVEVLFGEVWNRPFLDKKARSLITVAALTVLGREAQLRAHLRIALNNGVSKDEIVELMIHLAFYGGWPVSATGFNVATEVFKEVGLVTND
jgi:4-carboxymuconolactone decarboxylase